MNSNPVKKGWEGKRLLDRRDGDILVKPLQGSAEIADQHDFAFAGATERATGSEVLVGEGVNAFPAEHIAQMVGKRLLDQPVFAFDVGDHGRPK